MPSYLSTILHSTNNTPVTPLISIWITSSLPDLHLCDKSREAEVKDTIIQLGPFDGRLSFYFFERNCQEMFPFPKCYCLKRTRENFRGNFPESVHFCSLWFWKGAQSTRCSFLKDIQTNICWEPSTLKVPWCLHFIFYGMDHVGLPCTWDWAWSHPAICGVYGAHWDTLAKWVALPPLLTHHLILEERKWCGGPGLKSKHKTKYFPAL